STHLALRTRCGRNAVRCATPERDVLSYGLAFAKKCLIGDLQSKFGRIPARHRMRRRLLVCRVRQRTYTNRSGAQSRTGKRSRRLQPFAVSPHTAFSESKGIDMGTPSRRRQISLSRLLLAA